MMIYGNGAAIVGDVQALGARQSAASWWLDGGISPSNCIAAYQPKGAASYAASKINLANPGTYDAFAGIDPPWSAAAGWGDDTGLAYLRSGIVPTNTSWSYVVRFTQLVVKNNYPCGSSENNGGFVMRNFVSSNFSAWGNGGVYFLNAVVTGVGVTCTRATAGKSAYLDGVYKGAISSISYVPAEVYLMASNNGSTYVGTLAGNLAALAIYNTVLTGAQISALHAAMMAL